MSEALVLQKECHLLVNTVRGAPLAQEAAVAAVALVVQGVAAGGAGQHVVQVHHAALATVTVVGVLLGV